MIQLTPIQIQVYHYEAKRWITVNHLRTRGEVAPFGPIFCGVMRRSLSNDTRETSWEVSGDWRYICWEDRYMTLNPGLKEIWHIQQHSMAIVVNFEFFFVVLCLFSLFLFLFVLYHRLTLKFRHCSFVFPFSFPIKSWLSFYSTKLSGIKRFSDMKNGGKSHKPFLCFL